MDLKTLAGTLNLSSTTVSRVLNGLGDRYRIAPATQDRVRAAARRAGFAPNPIGRSLRLGTTETLGLIIPDISNPFFATLARHIERAARAEGYWVLLADSQESTEIEAEIFSAMKVRQVDGLIVAPVSGQGTSGQPCAQWTKPLVVTDRAPEGLHGLSVVVDNREAARQGVLYMVARGHRAIACLHGDSNSYADHERVQGYRTAMRESGLRVEKSWITGGQYSIESGSQGTDHLIASPTRPTAILALGNLLALGALNTLRENRLKVPEDVSLISFDELPWAASMAPPLTTIAQPVEDMGRMALGLLLQALRSKDRILHQRLTLKVSIIERKSVRRLH